MYTHELIFGVYVCNYHICSTISKKTQYGLYTIVIVVFYTVIINHKTSYLE